MGPKLVSKRAKPSIFRIIFHTVGQFWHFVKIGSEGADITLFLAWGSQKRPSSTKEFFLSFRKCSNQFFVESFENGKKGEEGIEGGQFDSYWCTVRFDSYWKKGEEGIEGGQIDSYWCTVRFDFDSYWYTVRFDSYWKKEGMIEGKKGKLGSKNKNKIKKETS